jgi:hypothetical protein
VTGRRHGDPDANIQGLDQFDQVADGAGILPVGLYSARSAPLVYRRDWEQPPRAGGWLADAGVSSGELVEAGLAYGDLLSPSGTMLYPRTTRIRADAQGGPVELGLGEVLADERDRLHDHAGIDERPPQTVEDTTGIMAIDDVPARAAVPRENDLWACPCCSRPHDSDAGATLVLVTVVGATRSRPSTSARSDWRDRASHESRPLHGR